MKFYQFLVHFQDDLPEWLKAAMTIVILMGALSVFLDFIAFCLHMLLLLLQWSNNIRV